MLDGRYLLALGFLLVFSLSAEDVEFAGGDVDVSGSRGSFIGVATRVKGKAKNPPKPTPKTPAKSKPKSASTVKPKPAPAVPAKPFNEDIWTYRRNCFAMTRGCPPKVTPVLSKRTPTRVPDPAVVVRRVVARLELPDPTPRFGPDPGLNEWKMAAVGFPLWLWTDGPATVRSTASRSGLTFTLVARWRSTTFQMGDGKKVTCAQTTRFDSQVAAGAKSPTCGYSYAQPSPKGRPYQLSATTSWRITWSALGRSGTIDATHTGSTTLNVGELNAVIVG